MFLLPKSLLKENSKSTTLKGLVLETNDDTISLEDAACGYKGLMVIERCFRSLKRTQIKMTPMYHWLARRIESHVRICVLALLVERIAELSCGRPWQQIRRDLETVQVSFFLILITALTAAMS